MVPTEDTFNINDTEEGFYDVSIKGIRRENRRTKQNSRNLAKKQDEQSSELQQANEVLGGNDQFSFSYHASRYEAGWLYQSLSSFYEMHWIKDINRLIKGGKEASVYLCIADDTINQPYLAAKVYRPRQFRNLKNDHVYRENRDYLNGNGHIIHDKRDRHAIDKKTDFGQQLTHTSWIEHEVQAMRDLTRAGADVPLVYTSGKNAILMTYMGDGEIPAPTLNEINLPPDLANKLFDRVVFNIEVMLQNNRIHADLSAYNILFWEDEIMLIDFPQVIDPLQNKKAWSIFLRDVTRVCQYFQRQGVKAEPLSIAKTIWKRNIKFFDSLEISELVEFNEEAGISPNHGSDGMELGF
jgi:RIO kinase 1